MPKADKKPKTVEKTKPQDRPLHATAPWTCRHQGDRSIIEAYVMGSGEWETIAEVLPSAYVQAEQTASYIVKAVNNYERHQKLISELAATLELCLACEGITWEVEQEAGVILRRIKQDS